MLFLFLDYTEIIVNHLRTGCVTDRRKLLLVPAISMAIASFQYSFGEGIAKAEFADSESFVASSNIDLLSSICSHILEPFRLSSVCTLSSELSHWHKDEFCTSTINMFTLHQRTVCWNLLVEHICYRFLSNDVLCLSCGLLVKFAKKDAQCNLPIILSLLECRESHVVC